MIETGWEMNPDVEMFFVLYATMGRFFEIGIGGREGDTANSMLQASLHRYLPSAHACQTSDIPQLAREYRWQVHENNGSEILLGFRFKFRLKENELHNLLFEKYNIRQDAPNRMKILLEKLSVLAEDESAKETFDRIKSSLIATF